MALAATGLAGAEPDVGGPTASVRDLWASLSMDEEALAAAADGLTAWFDEDGRHVLDRPLDFGFVEELALEDLRAEDVVGLADIGWDPLRRIERDELDEQLGRARGVLAAVPIACTVDAVRADLEAGSSLKLYAGDELASFAGVQRVRSTVRGAKFATLDIDGANTSALVDVFVQDGETSGDVTVSQRWQVDLYLERPDGALMLRAAWIEASSDSFGPESRVWTGWLLHEAFERAEAWNKHCLSRPAGPTLEAPRAPPNPVRALLQTQRDARGSEKVLVEKPEKGPPPPLLCEGVQLVEIEPWERRNVELEHSYSDSIGGEGNVRVDQEAIDRWVTGGANAWAKVLQLRQPSPADEVQLRRLAERFGDSPRLLDDGSKARLRARWHAGLLREVLSADPVVVPVCATDIDVVARALGYGEEPKRSEKIDDIEEIAAVALLEHGTIGSVPDESWAAVRQVLAFGEAIMDVFSRPSPALDGVVPDEGSPKKKKTFDIDAVDSNL